MTKGAGSHGCWAAVVEGEGERLSFWWDSGAVTHATLRIPRVKHGSWENDSRR